MENYANSGIEVEGATQQEAVEKALKQLGVKKDQVEIVILCEGKRGLFGLKGTKPAKVHVTLKKASS